MSLPDVKKKFGAIKSRFQTNTTQDGKPVSIRQIRPAAALSCIGRTIGALRGKESHPIHR